MLFKFSKSTINTRSSSVLLLLTPSCTSAKYYFSGFLEIMGSQTPANISKPKHKSSLTLLSHLHSKKSPSQVLCRDICFQSTLSALQKKRKITWHHLRSFFIACSLTVQTPLSTFAQRGVKRLSRQPRSVHGGWVREGQGGPRPPLPTSSLLPLSPGSYVSLDQG